MRSKKRLLLITMMLLSMIACIIGAVACGGGVSAKDAIANYLLPQDQTLVSADFTLPKGIGKDNSVPVTWTSSNENAIKIEDADTVYNAKVTLQDEVTEVTLTIHSGDNQKGFTVRVDELSVYTFISNFTFPQKNRAVKEDFELQTSMTIQGQAATISWAVPAGSQDYLSVVDGENGKKMVKVDLPEDIADVKIEATFSFKGVSKTQTYNFSVSPDLEPLQLVNRIYSRTDYPVELSGYVLHVYSSGNSDQYGPNATFYMIDDTLKYGYYMYQLALNEEDLDNFKEGVHVSVSGDKAKNHNGLWETNGKEVGKAVIIDDKTINPREHIYDFDTDLLSGVPSALWHESTYVRLTGWTVKAMAKDAPKVGTAGDLFTITNGDTTITVRYSTYIKRTDEENAALVGMYNTVKVGDIVTVTGILGNYNAFQIQPVVAGDIVVGSEAKTYENAPKVKAAVAAVDAKVKENFSSLVAADKTVKMPVSEDGVAISYRLAGKKLTEPTVVIADDGTFTITPTAKEKNYEVQVTYKIGDYEAYGFFQIHNWKKTDAEIVELVKKAIDEESGVIDLKVAGEIALPEVDTLGATVTWSVKDGTPYWIELLDDGAKVNVIELPNEATTITLVATITKGTASATTTITVNASAAPSLTFKALTEPQEGDFVYSAMKNGIRLYASSLELDGGDTGYIVTSDDISKAVKFTLVKKEGSDTDWYIKMGSKYLEMNPYANNGKTSYKLKLVAEPTAVWTWLDSADCFQQLTTQVAEAEPKTLNYYVGTYNSSKYTTLSPSDVSRITGNSAKDLDVTQHPARFGTLVEATDADKIANAKALLDIDTASLKEVGDEIALPAQGRGGVAISWAVDTQDYVKIESGKLVVKSLPKTGTVKVTVTATLTSGTATADTKEFTVELTAAGEGGEETTEPSLPDGKGIATAPATVTEALDVAKQLAADSYLTKDGDQLLVYVKGFVIDIGKWSDRFGNFTSVWIADKADSTKNSADAIQVYRLYLDDTNLKLVGDLAVGAEITLCGYLQNYKGENASAAPQFTYSGEKNDKHCVATAYTDHRSEAEKANAAIAAAKKSLESTYADGIGALVTEITLPVSTVTGVTLKYTASVGTIADGKLSVTHTASETTLTIDIEADGGTKATASLQIAAGVVIEDGDYDYDFTNVGNDSNSLSTTDLLSLLNGLTEVDIISSVDQAESVYKGQGSGGAHTNDPNMLKVGKSGSGTEIHLTFAKAVSKIVIECESWKDKTAKISVNGGTAQSTEKNTKGTFTFTFEAATKVTIKVETTAILIYKLTVTVGSAAAAASLAAPVALPPKKS